jgi:lipopolysaccharide transport system permease protein
MSLQEGLFDWGLLGYCGVLSLAVFFIGLIVFNRTGRNFIDTI